MSTVPLWGLNGRVVTSQGAKSAGEHCEAFAGAGDSRAGSRLGAGEV